MLLVQNEVIILKGTLYVCTYPRDEHVSTPSIPNKYENVLPLYLYFENMLVGKHSK
jgi:hypothetical protein